jgi:phospholipase/carboxylesterase
MPDYDFIECAPGVAHTGAPPPLLVVLHGFGANMSDLVGLPLDPRFHKLFVQAPLDLAAQGMPGGRAWFELSFDFEGIHYDEDSARAAISDFAAALPTLCAKAGADPDRITVLGFSQGAMIAHGLFLRHSSLLHSIVGLSGRKVDSLFDTAADLSGIADKPVFLSHGTFDPIIPVASGHGIRDFYAASPATDSWHEYPMGHEISMDCMRDLQRWFADCC